MRAPRCSPPSSACARRNVRVRIGGQSERVQRGRHLPRHARVGLRPGAARRPARRAGLARPRRRRPVRAPLPARVRQGLRQRSATCGSGCSPTGRRLQHLALPGDRLPGGAAAVVAHVRPVDPRRRDKAYLAAARVAPVRPVQAVDRQRGRHAPRSAASGPSTPAPEPPPAATPDVPVLVISGRDDIRTPLEGAAGRRRRLPARDAARGPARRPLGADHRRRRAARWPAPPRSWPASRSPRARRSRSSPPAPTSPPRSRRPGEGGGEHGRGAPPRPRRRPRRRRDPPSRFRLRGLRGGYALVRPRRLRAAQRVAVHGPARLGQGERRRQRHADGNGRLSAPARPQSAGQRRRARRHRDREYAEPRSQRMRHGRRLGQR